MKEFRPRLTREMLEALHEAVDREANRLAEIYNEKKRLHREQALVLMESEPIRFDKDPQYQELYRELEELRKRVLLLEEIALQFHRLLNGEVKGRKFVMRPWLSRIWRTGMSI